MKRILAFFLISVLTLTMTGLPALADEGETTPVDRAVEFGLEEEEPETFVPAQGDRMLEDIFEQSENQVSEPTQPANADNAGTPSGGTEPALPENATPSAQQGLYADAAPALRASDWAAGSIRVDFGWVPADTYRNDMQYPAGRSIAWLRIPDWSGGEAAIIDKATGQVVQSGKGANLQFSNLPAGTYTIRITSLDHGIYNIVESIVNGGPIPHLITEYETDVTIAEGDTTTILKWVAIEYIAYGFKTTTDIGHFLNGTDENVYYNGGNWSFPNTDPTTITSNPTFNTHNGIYYGDSASQYSGMNKLEVPTLSKEELDKGYNFVGWSLVGDDSGKIYTEADALSLVVTSNVEFKAVWSYPTHNVTFSTNTELGDINGQASYSYTRDFNNQLVNDIPVATPKPGYEFIGWFNDLTTNVIHESEIKKTAINRDLNFYAKYRKNTPSYTVKYLPGTDGSLTGTDQLMLKSGSFIPTIPTVNANKGSKFTDKWKVTAVSDGCDILKVGDVLNEIQISRLQIEFDVNFEAIYEKQPAPQPEPHPEPTIQPDPQPEPTTIQPNSESVQPSNAPVPGYDKSGKQTAPKTGDENNMILWLSVFAAGIVAAALVAVLKLKKRRKDSSK